MYVIIYFICAQYSVLYCTVLYRDARVVVTGGPKVVSGDWESYGAQDAAP